MPTLPNASGMSEMEAVKAIGAPKFTRGPLERVSNMVRTARGRHDLDGHLIAECSIHLGSAVATANAQLFSVAANLYDTLTHLIAAARKVSPSDPAAAEIIEMCARAEHEQAKARGETA